jgi:hypothetical protein
VAIAWHRVLHRLIAPFFCTSSLNLRLNFAYCVQKTLETHWGKHHRAYVTNLNNQIKGTELDSKDIVSIVNSTWNDGKPTPAFNNAAQTWSALLNSSPRTYCLQYAAFTQQGSDVAITRVAWRTSLLSSKGIERPL